jgi:hypothetical protein
MVSRLSLFAKCRVVSIPVKITVSVLLVIVASAYAEKRGADERTRTAYPCSLRVITHALQGVANAAYLEELLFPALLSVAPYCAPGGIRLVSSTLSHRPSTKESFR